MHILPFIQFGLHFWKKYSYITWWHMVAQGGECVEVNKTASLFLQLAPDFSEPL